MEDGRQSLGDAPLRIKCLRKPVHAVHRQRALRPSLPLTAKSRTRATRPSSSRSIFVSIAVSGKTPVPILAIALADAPRASSILAIWGCRTCEADSAVRFEIKPENVGGSLSPKGLASVASELLKKYGDGVAMVGSGMSDSPSVVAASVGIAFSSGTSVAIEAADIIVVAALHLSRIFTAIRRDVIWACLYNLLGISLAMDFFLLLGISLSSMGAGAGITFSSVSVATRSLVKLWIARRRA